MNKSENQSINNSRLHVYLTTTTHTHTQTALTT